MSLILKGSKKKKRKSLKSRWFAILKNSFYSITTPSKFHTNICFFFNNLIIERGGFKRWNFLLKSKLLVQNVIYDFHQLMMYLNLEDLVPTSLFETQGIIKLRPWVWGVLKIYIRVYNILCIGLRDPII